VSTRPIDIAAQAKIYACQCVITSTANWREGIAQKYPDVRNARAAAILRAIAAEQAEDLPDAVIAKVAAFKSLAAPARAVASRVGFSKFPDSLATFLDAVVAEAGR
jgi:hypothetical protein